MTIDKVLIIGLDGGTFDLVRRWSDEGALPNLKALMERGVSCDLNSTYPPVTSPAWPSFMTGMNPGKHGVFDFIRPRGTGYDMVNATSIQQPTLWQRLAAQGLRVGVVNVPVTYPPRPLEGGFMITGLLSPHAGDICTPRDLIARYERELGPYRVAPTVQYSNGEEERFIADVRDVVETRGRYALSLMQNEPWDVMMAVFGSTDIASHALWGFMDETHPRHNPAAPQHVKDGLRDLYALVDEQIGQMLAALPPNTAVIVMSDHGFGPLHYTINLNVMLMQAGLLHIRKAPLSRLKLWLFEHGVSPKSVYHMLEKLDLHHFAARVSKRQRNAVVGKFLSYDDIDWARTKAFSMGHVGQIYVNTKGKHPFGSVEPGAESEQVRWEVVQALEALRHPETGAPMVDRIIKGEEEYNGPYAERGPDLQVVLDDYRCISFPLFGTSPELFTLQIRGDTGCHRREGMFIAAGPGLRAGVERPAAHITDVAPTVMYLLGLPVPSEMDGHPLADMLDDPRPVEVVEADAPAVDPESGLTAEETAEIEDRLRGLGYLE